MWVTLNNGLMVNMDHASKVRRNRDGEFVVFGMNDEVLGKTGHQRFEEFLDELIPASAGQEVVVLTWYDEAGADIEIDRRAVVAWRISVCGSYPVLAGDELASNQDYLIPMPDGKYEEPFVATHASLDEAVEYFRQQHKTLAPTAPAPTP